MYLYLVTLVIAYSHLVNAKSKAGDFLRYHNEALTGHVIKTIASNYLDCILACGNMIGCRSINFYKDEKGKEKCELNKSTKTAHPLSMISKSGYEYDELTVST